MGIYTFHIYNELDSRVDVAVDLNRLQMITRDEGGLKLFLEGEDVEALCPEDQSDELFKAIVKHWAGGA